MHQSSSFFDKQTSGKVLKSYNNDADKSCSGLLTNMKTCISRLFSSISLVGVLFYNSWQLAIIAVFVLTCAMVPLMKIKSTIKNVYNKSEGENAKVLTTYNEAFAGHNIISAYNLYDLKISQFKKLINTVFGLRIKITQHVGWLSPYDAYYCFYRNRCCHRVRKLFDCQRQVVSRSICIIHYCVDNALYTD